MRPQIPQAEAADMGTSCTTISRKTLEVTGGTTDGTINATTGTLQQLGPAQELEYTKKLSILLSVALTKMAALAERCFHKDGQLSAVCAAQVASYSQGEN